jgi:hypothetical protein
MSNDTVQSRDAAEEIGYRFADRNVNDGIGPLFTNPLQQWDEENQIADAGVWM